MELDDLDRIWSELSKKEGDDKDYVMRKFSGNKRIWLAVDPSRKFKGLILRLDIETKKLPLPKATSFTIEYIEKKNQLLIWLGLKEIEYYNNFKSMVFQVAFETDAMDDDKSCLSIFIENIISWQNFLINKPKKAPVSYIKGLFGELSYLRFLVKKNISTYDQAINAWHEGDPKRDLYFEKGAIEVKATISNTPEIIQISNLKQLDETTASNLFLGLCILNDADDRGLYLNELVAKIIEELKESHQHLIIKFKQKLIKEKYTFEDPEYYNLLKLSVFKVRTFHVKEDFPRITPSSIEDINRPGIQKVKYEIQYGNLSKFEIGDKIIKEIL